jgi:malate dehydrogenase (oxaloacetate-decarboxylating)(NADP+)
VQVAVEECLSYPQLIGRPEVIRAKIRELGLRLTEGEDYQVVGVDDESLLTGLAEEYYQL